METLKVKNQKSKTVRIKKRRILPTDNFLYLNDTIAWEHAAAA